jgi:hypothetical protein
MANTIDCSMMSHASCLEMGDPAGAPPVSAPPQPREPQATSPGTASLRDAEGQRLGGASYDCVNDCASSQGVTALLSGATASLGCLMVPLACPVFIGTTVGALLGACEMACEDLESKP